MLLVYAILDIAHRPNTRSATPSRRSSAEKAERFIEEVRGDEPEIAAKPRIEERELDVGGRN